MWNAHNTVFGSKQSAICAQAVYFLHSTMPSSRACEWVMSALSAVLLSFSFQFRSAFLPCRSAKLHSGVLGLPNIRHQTLPKIWVGFLNDFKLILAVKMKIRHTIEGSFGSEFRVICNHCVFMATWSGKTANVKLCIIYLPPQKKCLPLKLLLSRPKSARASPQQCTKSAPDFILISALSAKLKPKAWTLPNRPI